MSLMLQADHRPTHEEGHNQEPDQIKFQLLESFHDQTFEPFCVCCGLQSHQPASFNNSAPLSSAVNSFSHGKYWAGAAGKKRRALVQETKSLCYIFTSTCPSCPSCFSSSCCKSRRNS